MEEVGAQVAVPMVIHQTMAQRFCNMHPIAKKRTLPFQSSNFVPQNPGDNWNPKSWDWDSRRFVAKPLQYDGSREAQIPPDIPRRQEVHASTSNHAKSVHTVKDDENLQLKLGDGAGNSGANGMNLVEEMQPVSRASKRVRSGSPSAANHPICQVDDCKEDLSAAKDYHRRHKVCEVHSKSSKALVGKQMQRFCQQCSRFHLLSEFDEGKRSCRRRLAGHNRRRRKTQPDDATPRMLIPGSPPKNSKCDLDIINLLAVLARAQAPGNTDERSGMVASTPEKDQLIQILNRINSLPLPAHLAAKIPLLRNANGSTHNATRSENQNQVSGSASLPSTMDLLAVLSAPPGAPSSDALEMQSQPSTEGSDSEKSKSPCFDQAAHLNLQRRSMTEFPSAGGVRSSSSYHSPAAEVDCPVQETSTSLNLQLCSSSPEDNSTRILPMTGNYPSSNSSNPSGERSPVSSPLVHDLFPMHSSRQAKDGHLSNSEEELAYAKATMSNGCSTSLQLFGNSIRATENASIQSSPYRAGYTSSGSDHSPSSLNSDTQDRTGRIIFKLFDKDPSQLPGSLRSQIFNWLSNSPTEMESYIKPGCIVLSLYLSMPSIVWDQLEENLHNYVNSLVKDTDVDFWGSGRFLVYTKNQMVSHNNGLTRLSKSWKTWSTPKLISISPVAVVAGQETSLILKGRRLSYPETKIHCTHADGYNIVDVKASSSEDAGYDEICLGGFKVNGEASNSLGRCFIEVENGFKGTTFPIIIADNKICQELTWLEPEFYGVDEVCNRIPTNHSQNTGIPSSRMDALHFLNELGWLFQRKRNASFFEAPEYRLSRFKFLLVFSVEHDFCAVVRTLLDILLELNLSRRELAGQSLAMLSDVHLLNRAVKRRCRSMVDLLVHYSIVDPADDSKKFLFVPNLAGPGGITPLHLAACTSSTEDIIDALTNDPQEVGLNSWNSVLDTNGLSPYAYAVMRNNLSYNALVSRKLAERQNPQISIPIENETSQFQIEMGSGMDKNATHSVKKPCSKCASIATRGYGKRFAGSQGLLQRPYIHSMLVVAAVCVCVCVFLRGHPYIGCVAPFSWENLDFGAF